MIYFEQRALCAWSPVTADAAPRLTSSGRIAKAQGAGPMVRRIKTVDEAHRGLPLAELEAIYGTAAAEVEEAAERAEYERLRAKYGGVTGR